MKNNIEILTPGLLTTIQDSGRYGYQQFGMSVSGSMDILSQKLANLLVGNDEDEAVLEATFFGPTIKFNTDDSISITGADMGAKINGENVKMWETISVYQGDELSFSGLKNGARTYIAFSKKLDVEEIMGSKSTFLKGEIGGFKGRKLEIGDKIPLKDIVKSRIYYKLPTEKIPKFDSEFIHVILGPQDYAFTDKGINTFFESEYRVSNDSDRMGYRLTGPKIEHKEGADIISDGINIGAIQVPGHGEPIIMMADRQTTGGYAKIGNILTSDLPNIAQKGPGAIIKFKEISIEDGQKNYIEFLKNIAAVKHILLSTAKDASRIRTLRIKVEDVDYIVEVEEIE